MEQVSRIRCARRSENERRSQSAFARLLRIAQARKALFRVHWKREKGSGDESNGSRESVFRVPRCAGSFVRTSCEGGTHVAISKGIHERAFSVDHFQTWRRMEFGDTRVALRSLAERATLHLVPHSRNRLVLDQILSEQAGGGASRRSIHGNASREHGPEGHTTIDGGFIR